MVVETTEVRATGTCHARGGGSGRPEAEVTGTGMAEGVGQTGSRGCPGLGRGSRPLGPGRERRTETQRHGEVAGQRYGLPPRPRSPLGRRSGYAADVRSPGCKKAGPALAESEAKAVVKIVTKPGASLG